MRIVVFSDVHAILPAWKAFQQDVARLQPAPDAFWCLGDLVGYGTQPVRVVHAVREFMQQQGADSYCLLGNHDRGLLQIIDGEETRTMFDTGNPGGLSGQSNLPFQECALKILRHHARTLQAKSDAVDWLRTLSPTLAPPGDSPLAGFRLAHGFFHQRPATSLWEYGSKDASQVRKQMTILDEMSLIDDTQCVLLGHYHLPAIWQVTTHDGLYDVQAVDIWSQPAHVFPVESLVASTLVINPGSISLPRQQHRAACATYLILDVTPAEIRIQFRRLRYTTAYLTGKTGVIRPGYPCYDVLVDQLNAVTNCIPDKESPSRS